MQHFVIFVCLHRYIDDLTIEFDRCQEAEHVRMEFFKKTLYKLKNALDLSKNARYSKSVMIWVIGVGHG